jgi:hypothetical protein
MVLLSCADGTFVAPITRHVEQNPDDQRAPLTMY